MVSKKNKCKKIKENERSIKKVHSGTFCSKKSGMGVGVRPRNKSNTSAQKKNNT